MDVESRRWLYLLNLQKKWHPHLPVEHEFDRYISYLIYWQLGGLVANIGGTGRSATPTLPKKMSHPGIRKPPQPLYLGENPRSKLHEMWQLILYPQPIGGIGIFTFICLIFFMGFHVRYTMDQKVGKWWWEFMTQKELQIRTTQM